MKMIKRKYTKPEIQNHYIDSTVSIAMASEGKPPGPGQPGAANTSSDRSTQSPLQDNPFDESNLK